MSFVIVLETRHWPLEWISHGANAVLRWLAGNASIETEAADNQKPSKQKFWERIDGIIELIMGQDWASRPEEFRNGYEKRGPLLIRLNLWGSRRARQRTHGSVGFVR